MEGWQTLFIIVIAVIVYMGIGIGLTSYLYQNKAELSKAVIVTTCWPVMIVAFFAADIFGKIFSYRK